MISENLWKELYAAVEKEEWGNSLHIFDLLILQFFYPEKIPDFYKHIENKDVLQLIKDVKLKRYKAGEVIVQEGGRSDSMFIIVHGIVDVSCVIQDKGRFPKIPVPCVMLNHVVSSITRGKRIFMSQLRDGDIFGEMALISSNPRTATVIAKTDVDLIKLKKDVVDKILKKNIQLKNLLHDLYFSRVDKMLTKIKEGDKSKKGLLGGIFNSIETKKLADASSNMDELIEKEPFNPSNHLKKADILFREGMHEEALRAYHQAASLLAEQGFLRKALVVYRIIDRINPDNAEAKNSMETILSEINSIPSPPFPSAISQHAITSMSDHGLFSTFAEKEIKEILTQVETRQYVQGDTVIQQGEPGDSIYIIKEGNAQVVTQALGENIQLSR